MEKYRIPMVPGPVSVPQEILDAAAVNYGSADLETEYLTLYTSTAKALQKIMRTRNQVVIQTGEGMQVLWGALKSVLFPGDRVLALSTGLFGYGIGGMAESIGCEVRTMDFGFNESVNDLELVERTIRDFQPKMITLVHCETPSGTLNDVARIGELKARHGVPLLYVDAVSGLGGCLFRTDEWQVDLCLGASQKCFSAPANLSFLSVSEKAWALAEERNYAGYDALLPFRYAVKSRYFPYTPYWHGTAQLHKACERILREGLNRVMVRHERVAAYCRKRITGMGLELFAAPGALLSPTVTAVRVPAGLSWKKLDARLREQGVAMGGNYGCLAGRVFRVGHMGSQADPEWVKEAMDVLSAVL